VHVSSTKRPLNRADLEQEAEVKAEEGEGEESMAGYRTDRLLKILQEQEMEDRDVGMDRVDGAELKAVEQLELEQTAREEPVHSSGKTLAENLAKARELVAKLKELESEIDVELTEMEAKSVVVARREAYNRHRRAAGRLQRA
jgi:hypothetical protein